MKELELNELREIQLKLLKILDEFCKKNDIKYYLCNGTLLGAVKYGGYIPWDDDIDVLIPREDYCKLLRLFDNDSQTECKLLFFREDGDFLYPFAKLSDSKTILFEQNVKNTDLGVNIDIFPLDNYGSDEAENHKTYEFFENLRKKLNWSKLVDYKSNTIIKAIGKILVSSIYKIFGPKYFCKKIIKYATQNRSDNYIGNCTWGFYGAGEALPKEVFSESVLVDFEGGKYPAPVGYDKYLRGLYGDYEKDPPKEKQQTHHKFIAYYK